MTCRKEEGGPWAPQRRVDPMINVVSLLLLWDGEKLGILGSYWAYIYIGPIGYNIACWAIMPPTYVASKLLKWEVFRGAHEELRSGALKTKSMKSTTQIHMHTHTRVHRHTACVCTQVCHHVWTTEINQRDRLTHSLWLLSSRRVPIKL